MKVKIWVLSSCLPDEGKPCLPSVFTDEAEARAAFDKVMRDEWEVNAPYDDDGERLPYPDDPDAAHAAILDDRRGMDGETWGQWELTSHQVELPAAIQKAIATLLTAAEAEVEDIVTWMDGALYDDDKSNAARLASLRSAIAAFAPPAAESAGGAA